MSGTTAPAGPIVDRLTGLAGREQIVRVVDQADRDRDRLIAAVLAIDGLAEINQLSGHDAGDALLRRVGPVLGQQVSVDVTVGRIGGGRLGLVVAPAGDREPESTVRPVLEALGGALAAWSADQATLGTPSPVEPAVRAGVAVGEGASTLVAAEAALAAALADPDGPSLVLAGSDHPGLVRHRRRRRVIEHLVETIDRGLVSVADDPIEDLTGAGAAWRRLRPDSTVPVRSGDPAALDHRDLGPTPGLAARLDRLLLTRAADAAAATAVAAHGSTVIVPLLGPLAGRRSAMSGEVPTGTGHLVVEAARSQLTGIDPAALARRLGELGLTVGVVDAVGGWDDARLLRQLPVHHVRPVLDLAEAAVADDPAGVRALDDLVTIARGLGADVVAPAGLTGGDDATLRRLGCTRIHRQA